LNIGPDFKAFRPVPFADMVKGKDQVAGGQPARGAFLSRIHKRRFQSLHAAAGAVEIIPSEGEAVHVVMSGSYDLQLVLIVLLDRLGSPCETMRVATLSLSRRNVQEMAELLDSGKVKRLEILTSDFFAKHDIDIFAELVQELHIRGQRVAAARSHCKIVTMALEDGRRYTLEGSPNLRTNKNMEQFALTCNRELHSHYDRFLDALVTTHEIGQQDGTGKS
jgi:hypothetical protein